MNVRFLRKSDRYVDIYAGEELIKEDVLHHQKSGLDQRAVVLFLWNLNNEVFDPFQLMSRLVFEDKETQREVEKNYKFLLG